MTLADNNAFGIYITCEQDLHSVRREC